MKKILILLITFFAILSSQNAFAAEVSYFDVQFPSNAQKGEALDLTITAMDSENNILDDYVGTVLIFSETDPKAELSSPIYQSTYTFSVFDEGVLRIEKGLTFNSIGLQNLHVYDLNDYTDSVFGKFETFVEDGDVIQDISVESNSGEASYLDLQVDSNTVKVDQAVSVIVTAMDSENNIVDDYTGEITIYSATDYTGEITIYSATDSEVGMNSFYPTFSLSDAGQITLDYDIVFSEEGMHQLEIYSIDDAGNAISGSIEIVAELDEKYSADKALWFSIRQKELEEEYARIYGDDGGEFVTSAIQSQMEEEYYNLENASNNIDQDVEEAVIEQTKTEKVGEMIVTSFRKIRKPFTPIIVRSSDEGNETGEMSPVEKMGEMIVTSFRKVRKPFTPIIVISSENEDNMDEINKKEKLHEVIVTSFRKVKPPRVPLVFNRSDTEQSTSEMDKKEKMLEVIVTSFRKERAPRTPLIINTSNETEGSRETEKKESMLEMIITSFRK